MLYISVISANIAILSFIFNFLTYRNRLRLEQASNAVMLHEKWWSKNYLESRKRLYKIVKELDKGEEMNEICKVFLSYYSSSRSTQQPEEIADFVRIVFFFADLNVYIDEQLINLNLAYRLLGNSQYTWFQKLINEVRETIRANISTSDIHDYEFNQHNRVVRWIPETEALEEKFERHKRYRRHSTKFKRLTRKIFLLQNRNSYKQ